MRRYFTIALVQYTIVPAFVADSTVLLSGIMVPAMLIPLGSALARLKVRDTECWHCLRAYGRRSESRPA